MLKIPNVFQFHELPPFFGEFFRLNLGDLTHRSFAKTIGWPASLMGDVIAKRRNLSIERAIEFSRHAGMTAIEAERLVVLAMSDIGHAGVKDYAETFLKTEGRYWPLAPADQPRLGWNTSNSALALDLHLNSLWHYLIWCGGQTTEQEVGQYVEWSEPLKDLDILNSKMNMLRQLGIISGNFPNVTVLVSEVAIAEDTCQGFYESLNTIRYSKRSSSQKMTVWRATCLFPRELYVELNQRVHQLQNWILNQTIGLRTVPREKRQDYVFLQTNFAINNLFDIDRMGLRVAGDSMELIGAPAEKAPCVLRDLGPTGNFPRIDQPLTPPDMVAVSKAAPN